MDVFGFSTFPDLMYPAKRELMYDVLPTDISECAEQIALHYNYLAEAELQGDEIGVSLISETLVHLFYRHFKLTTLPLKSDELEFVRGFEQQLPLMIWPPVCEDFVQLMFGDCDQYIFNFREIQPEREQCSVKDEIVVCEEPLRDPCDNQVVDQIVDVRDERVSRVESKCLSEDGEQIAPKVDTTEDIHYVHTVDVPASISSQKRVEDFDAPQASFGYHVACVNVLDSTPRVGVSTHWFHSQYWANRVYRSPSDWTNLLKSASEGDEHSKDLFDLAYFIKNCKHSLPRGCDSNRLSPLVAMCERAYVGLDYIAFDVSTRRFPRCKMKPPFMIGI